MTLCKCGCGKECKEGNVWINGHNRRGKNHTDKTRDFQKRIKIGNKNCLGHQNTLGLRHSDKTKKQISDSLKGNGSPNWRGGKRGTLCSYCGNIIERSLSAINSGNNFCSRGCYLNYKLPSNIEILMQEILSDIGYRFKAQVHILNYRVDILLIDYNIIIECDGDYWHGNEEVLENLEDWHFDMCISDSIRDRKLRKAGYTVLRFWEYDIINNIKWCQDQITLNINL